MSKGNPFVCVSVALALVLTLVTPALAAQPDPDRYIVKFNNPGQGQAALRAAGARVDLDLERHGAVAAHIPAQALAALQKNPNIAYIERDVVRVPLAQTTPWGIPAVQADLVSDAQAANRTVCIIDSGYDNGHEDLAVLGAGNGSPDPGTGDPLVDNCHHGTHVAGTIAALTNGTGVLGVLPSGNVGLHIVKVFGDSCAWAYSSSLIAALDACMTDGNANVVSMSLGGSFKSRTEENAFDDAFAQGVLSVAAAGNDGNTRHSYPASYGSVISVAAVDSALTVADFSQQTDQVELAGPGVAVRSTVQMGAGNEEGLSVGGQGFEATAMEGSPAGSGSGNLFRCNAVDGLGSPGDCAGASGQVCLIQRGAIAFVDKVQECEAQGGNGAIIYNNAPALFSGTLGGTATSIQSVGVSGDDGAVLLGLLGQAATVTTDVGNYAFFDGTSMATPHVSGVAAVVWSHDTACTNQEIRDVLAATALDLGPAGRDNAYGHGLVQAADAVLALDCGGGPGGCTLGQPGDACSSNSDCCSNSCKGKPGNKTCK